MQRGPDLGAERARASINSTTRGYIYQKAETKMFATVLQTAMSPGTDGRTDMR